jgi:hypothetical protein
VGWLTTATIQQMIRGMLKRRLAAFLILGWVLLSGLDLIEDFGEISAAGAVANAASADSLKLKRTWWGALADNMVESATRLPHAFVELAVLIAVICSFDVATDFRRCSRLHKLLRVFLI